MMIFIKLKRKDDVLDRCSFCLSFSFCHVFEEIMRIAVIDADLIGRKKHRFPNLVCEKISGYYKNIVKLHPDDVVLKTDYEDLEQFDRIFIAKYLPIHRCRHGLRM